MTLTDIRNKIRHIVTYFRTSTTAKEKLAQVQLQMGGPVKKLMNEVSTRWNSTYLMLERMAEQKESVLVSLASLKSDIPQLTTNDYKIIEETLRVLAPFNQATVELSEEKKSVWIKSNPNAQNVAPLTATQCIKCNHGNRN